MYTEIDRQEILEKIVSILSSTCGIEGALLVGSGANGFSDRWSDIDLSIVVYPGDNTRMIWDKLNERILKEFDVLKVSLNEYGANNYISVILLTNFLELDMGVISLSNLTAKRDQWKILFDKSGKVSEKMEETWAKRRVPVLSTVVEQSLDSIWYHIKNAAFAVKRNKPYRAVKELEEFRNEIVELKALHENKIAKHFRDVDEMDGLFTERLGQTFFKELTIDSLAKVLIIMYELYFDVVKEIHNNFEVIQYENQLREFLRDLELIK